MVKQSLDAVFFYICQNLVQSYVQHVAISAKVTGFCYEDPLKAHNFWQLQCTSPERSTAHRNEPGEDMNAQV